MVQCKITYLLNLGSDLHECRFLSQSSGLVFLKITASWIYSKFGNCLQKKIKPWTINPSLFQSHFCHSYYYRSCRTELELAWLHTSLQCHRISSVFVFQDMIDPCHHQCESNRFIKLHNSLLYLLGKTCNNLNHRDINVTTKVSSKSSQNKRTS